MTQYEIIQILKENKSEWLTARQIADKLGINSNSIIRCMSKLAKSFPKNIKVKEIRIDKVPRLVRAYQYTESENLNTTEF